MTDRNDLRRMLRQTLELYRGMGVEQIPFVAPVPPATSTPAAPLPAAERPSKMPVPGRAVGSPAAPWLHARRPVEPPGPLTPETTRVTVPTSQSMPNPTTIQHSDPLRVSTARPAATSTEERAAVLKGLELKVRACQRCPELASSRKQTVFGVGNPSAKILFVGEAPGADEDEQGEPFVGKAGRLLDDIIEACLLKRSEIYICNILKCRPPGNRTPLEPECQNCREFLDGQLTTIDPEYIICWGSTAAQNLLQTKQPIGKLRKQFFRHGRAKVLCTYHPSYLLRNPPAKKEVWEDMKFWRTEMGVDLSQVRRAPPKGTSDSPG